ncbi:hypothetical protein [Paenibacillus daejeonensis]|uniref:hypothetical protein n=1 Tax=Paenibacillus daejeonensis TaxID=135193 RepID=UPI00036882F2|nr:hypothetical protein [Paenibacillus daejeonensis]
MSQVRRLDSEADFAEALENGKSIRVFKDDQMIEARAVIVRYDDRLIVTQSSVSDIAYHERDACEFYEIRNR